MSLDTAPKLAYRRIFGFALETANGTPVTPTATDAVTTVFGDIPIIRYSTEKVERQGMGSLSPIQQYIGAASGTATFETELVGNGATGTAIWTRLLQGCGYQNNAGVWTPITGATQTLTLMEWIDGKARQLSGCMGSFSIVLRRGQKGRIRWNFTGVRQPSVDASNPAPTFNKVVAPRVGASSFTIGAAAYHIPEVTINAGNEVILREDVTAVDSASNPVGYRCAYITGRRATITAAPESVPAATHSWFTDFTTLVQAAFSVQVGSTANNQFTIAAPKIQLDQDPEWGEREKMLVDNLQFLCCRSADAGDDELSITMA